MDSIIGKKLSMSDDEILVSYKTAKDPKAQIKILAELNAVSRDDICTILKYKGIDGRSLKPRKPKTKVSVPKPKESETISKSDVITYIKSLTSRRYSLQCQIDEIDRELDELRGICQIPEVESH